MKTKKIKAGSSVLMLIVLTGMFINVQGQTNLTICGGESVNLVLPAVHGDIQWQRSTNLSSWTDMTGATGQEYTFNPVTTYYYRAKVTEGSCNPLYSDTFKVTVNPQLYANAGRDTFMCQGSVMALGGNPTAKGGMGPYTYQWSPSTGLNDPTRAIPTSSVGTSTTYNVMVTDKNGCKASDTVSLSVVPVPTADAGTDKTLCSGTSAVIGGNPSANGGTPPYKYEWNPSSYLDDQTVSNPAVTPISQISTNIKYKITVKDQYECTATDEMTVTVSALPVVNAGIDTGICQGGSILIGGNPSAGSGKAPYTYLWSPSTGLSATNISNPSANPTTNTTYVLQVTDDNGCKGIDTMKLEVAPVLEANCGSDTFICRDGSVMTGGIPAAKGGKEPYTYSWTPNFRINNRLISNPTVSPNATMYYYLLVSDRYKCQASDSVLITVGTALPEAGTDTVLCYGFSKYIGGYPAAVGYGPFKYQWTPTTGLDNDKVSNPLATPGATTKYKLEVRDVYGCSSYDSVTVSVNPQIVADAGNNQSTCTNMKIGGSPTASGGTSPYTYVWSPSTGLSNPNIANPIAAPSTTTTYTVRVIDKYGCESKDSMTLTITSKPVADAGPDKGWCNSPVSLGGSPTASGGAGGYTYKWAPSTGLSADNVANPITTIKQSVTYVVTITDASMCTGVDSMQMKGGLEVDAGRDTTVTSGTLTIGGNPTAKGGVPPYTYSWSPSTNLSGTTVSNPVFTAGITITYYLTVTDSNGCTNTDSVTLKTCTTSTGKQTFSYTGSSQMFIVPKGSCVTQLTVTCSGAGGGGSNGGKGGLIQGTVNVKAGDTLIVIVGGAGKQYVSSNRAGSGGGGFSGLLHSWAGYHIISAGGGGGGAGLGGTSNGSGGDGGGSSGGAQGGTGGCGAGGKGGASTGGPTGGTGGTGYTSGGNGNSSGGGSGGQGSNYSTCTYCDMAGGGGGGGYGASGGSGGVALYGSTYDGGAGGYGGGGGGGAGGYGSSNNRMSGGGGGGGGHNSGYGGDVDITQSCGTSGGGGGGGGANFGKSGIVTITTNTQGGGAATQSNGSVTIEW